jgi:hypothetical protein
MFVYVNALMWLESERMMMASKVCWCVSRGSESYIGSCTAALVPSMPIAIFAIC